MSAQQIAEYDQIDNAIAKKGKTDKPLMNVFSISNAQKKEFTEDDKNQELISHIKKKTNPVKEFVEENWNWDNDATWKSPDLQL